jgi:hypothetical protein
LGQFAIGALGCELDLVPFLRDGEEHNLSPEDKHASGDRTSKWTT